MPVRVPSTNSTFVSSLIHYKHIMDSALIENIITKDNYRKLLDYYNINSQSLMMYWLGNLNYHQQKIVYSKKQ